MGQWVKSINGIGIVPVWVTSKEPNKRKQNQTPKNPTQFKNSSKETQKKTWKKHIMHTQRTKQEKIFILSRLHFRRSTSARVLTAGHAMLRAMKEIYPLNPDPLGLRAFWNFRVKTDQRNGRQHAHINYLSPQLPRSCRSVGTPAQAFS